MTRTGRHYHKCLGCLLPFVTDAYRLPDGATCSICGSLRFHHMGEVFKVSGQLVAGDAITDCKCDSKCTCATGPECDCRCGGENHGAGMAATFERLASGAVQVKLAVPEKAQARSRLAATEYQAALAQAQTEEAPFRGCGSGYYWRGERLVREAQASRSHGTRMRKLKEALSLFSRERDRKG
ncbi:MAG: hypothetical protein WC326_01905 [Candidatus Delongbacteria bacterium]